MAENPFKDILLELGTKRARRAMARTLSKAATSVRAAIAQRARADLKIKSSDVKGTISVNRARASGSQEPASQIIIDYKPMPLVKFGARAKRVRTDKGPRQGVTAVLKGQRKLVHGAFLATMRDGYVGVFKRQNAGGLRGVVNRIKGKTGHRAPLKQLFSTAVQELFSGNSMLNWLSSYARERVETIFKQEANYELSKPLNKDSSGS